MPQITSVELQKKTLRLRSGQALKRFNIFIDGQFAFGADEDLVVNYRLTPRKVISENDFNHLIGEVEVGKLMEKMYNLFSIRQRSEKEIRDYFKNLSFKRKIKDKEEISDLVIDQLVEKLKQKGMINDMEFAKAWVDSRMRSKAKSLRVLKLELIKKGISKDIIDEVLSSMSQVINEEELAKRALEKKLKSWKNLEPQEFKKKATEFLLRRGFEYSVIRKVLEES